MQNFTQKPTFTVNALKGLFTTILAILFSLCAGNVSAQITGVKSIPGDYGTLTLAIQDLNLVGVGAGGVTLNVLPGNAQSAPAGGYSITTLTGTNSNPIIITGNGNTVTASSAHVVGNLNDAIFKIIGSDFVTIQGFTMLENPANTATTAASNNMTEWGVALLYASTTNGAQDITIQNNTITLNRTYQNTFGIYSNSTHTATAPTTSASATTVAGSNSNTKIYANNISNVNNGIVIVGPAAAADFNTGIDIGGTSGSTANTISDFGTTGTFSGYANVSATVYGILVRNATGFNVSRNSVTSSAGGVTVGTLRGIYVPAFSVAPAGTFTNSINNNTVALSYGVSSGILQGITVEATTGTATATLTVNNNNFTSLTGAIATSATVTAISIAMANLNTTINSNTLTNITTNTTGGFTFISHAFTVPPGGTQDISSNSIVTGLNKTGVGGTVAMMTSASSTVSATSVTHTNNNFSNITVTGATVLNGIANTDGLSTLTYGRTVTGNTFSNWTGGTSAVTIMSYSYWGGTTATLSNNTISNIISQGAITGITIPASGNTATQLNIASNSVTNLTSSGTGGAVIGITSSNTSPEININNNVVSGLSTTGAAAVTGISTSGSTVYNIFKNRVCDLSSSNVSSSAIVNGILSSTGTVTMSNNRVADLRPTLTSAANAAIGISITGGTTMNVYYNSVYLNATSTGTIFGSSAISVSSTPTATLRNNIFINTSTPNTTGFTVAYRRSSTTLTSYAAASNNNIFFAGTPGASNLIYYDGTNSDQTNIAYKSRVSPRDNFSYTENTPFLSTTCSNANFLKVNTGTPTFAEGLGAPISGFTDDFENQARNVSTPDIGADEFNGTQVQVININSVSINPTGNLCVAAGRTVTANITIGASLATSVTLNYSFNGGTSVPVTMTGGTNSAGATSNWTGTIPVATPANAIVTWNVTAIDPLITKSTTGTTYRDEPLSGASASITGTPNPVCEGSPIALTAQVITAGKNATLGTQTTTL
jgi:hypothetical protein